MVGMDSMVRRRLVSNTSSPGLHNADGGASSGHFLHLKSTENKKDFKDIILT
jgi:hypothetical protein